MFVVTVHAAFVEVDGGVLPTGTLTTVDEVEAAQTSSAVLAVQFSYSPLCLLNRGQYPFWQRVNIHMPNAADSS